MKQTKKGKLGIRVLTAFLSVALLVTMTPLAAVSVSAAEDQPAQGKTETLKLAILSDIHYVSDANRANADTEGFKNAELTEMRMMKEIGAILDEALDQAATTGPDAMLVCGDLCSNGERENESELATTLKEAGESQDRDIYVINGNHDINNSYSAKFGEDGVTGGARTQAEEFKEIYDGLGYGEKARYYDAAETPGADVRNYGGLSYATEIQDGVTLIALDTGQYSNDTAAGYNKAQITAGTVSDGLLDWAVSEAKAAKAKGNLVLAMCHHSIIPHYSVHSAAADAFFGEYLVPNWEHIAGTLADAGVSAILTGHSHANDISQHTTKAGNTIYDIQTAALCAYPCAWRTLEITIDKSDKTPSYSFDIDTHFIEGSDKLASLTNDYDYITKSGEKHEYSSLQGYSFDKTALAEGSLTQMAGYFIRSYLYDIKTHEDGFQGFLQEQIKTDGKTVGEYSTEQVAGLIDKAEPIVQKFSFFGSDYTLKIERNAEKSSGSQKIKIFDVSLSYGSTSGTGGNVKIPVEDGTVTLRKIIEEMNAKQSEYEKDYVRNLVTNDTEMTFELGDDFPEATRAQLAPYMEDASSTTKTETGTLTIDLSGFAGNTQGDIDQLTGIDGIIEKADRYIDEDDKWDNNYQRTTIEEQAAQVITKEITPAFTKPIEADDAQTAPIFIARDAFQAFARGDEADEAEAHVPAEIYGNITAQELKEKRAHWHELILGEAFEKNLKDQVASAVTAVADDPEYSQFGSLLETSLAPGEGKHVMTLTADEGSYTTLTVLGSLLGSIDTPKQAIGMLSILRSFGIDPFAPLPMKKLATMLADLQLALTTDTSITSDSVWDFHTVAFDAQGGKVSTQATMTVDGHAAGALPTPAMDDANFLGWFTQAEGGEQVTADTDCSEINKVYAHWKMIDRKTKKGEDGTAFGKGAALEAAEAALAKMTSDKDPAGTKIAPLLLKSAKQTKKSVKLTWKKVPGAKEYVVYGGLCGKGKKVKKLLTTTGTSYNVKKAGAKLKKGKYYKFIVIAIDGKNNVVSSSKIVHAATAGSKKAANPKKVTVKAKINKSGKKLKKWKKTGKITLRAGSTPKNLVKSTKLKGSFTKAKKAKVKKHVAMRYESSNPMIAAVSAGGQVTAKKKGTCKIYVYAQNGAVKTVTVVVK